MRNRLITLLFVVLGSASAWASTSGDLFISMHDGTVQWRSADGTLLRTLVGVSNGKAEGMAFDAENNLYVTHHYASDLQSGNTVSVFDAEGDLLGEFGNGYDCNPHSLVFDAQGHCYVGQADCAADVLRFDGAGGSRTPFDVARENRGSNWVDLADDQCTLFYTSEGRFVKRYNVCSGAQLANFNLLPLPFNLFQGSQAHALKILADGGVLVANFTEIVRLSASGSQAQTYDRSGPDGWMGLDVDLDGTSFWATNYSTSDVVKFDIATGGVLFAFNTGTPAHSVKGVAVRHSAREILGRMTGGGSVFTASGMRVTHGFQLHCDADDPPNNLEVNWEGNKFHLEELTSAFCTDDPTISPGQPPAPFDTYRGTGIGRYNQSSGATAEWTFTDAGEPGVNDRATITVRDASGTVVMTVSGTLTFGNHQAHKQ